MAPGRARDERKARQWRRWTSRMSENLPRQPRHHELSEAQRVCQSCGQIRIDIGADRSEQLDYRPASLPPEGDREPAGSVVFREVPKKVHFFSIARAVYR